MPKSGALARSGPSPDWDSDGGDDMGHSFGADAGVESAGGSGANFSAERPTTEAERAEAKKRLSWRFWRKD
jgi:hypothetical protein